jgi:4-hydroxybenzoate polyprenyltransferase
MTHIVWWARNVQRDGIELVYSGVYPESYLIYPPGMAYAYQAALHLSESDLMRGLLPGASGDSLRRALKLIPAMAHLALAMTLFGVVAAVGGFWRGWVAASLYAWNPAALFDAGYWGQGDSLYATLLALGVGTLILAPDWWPLRSAGRWRLGAQAAVVAAGGVAGVLLGAASLVKPQTWIFLPVLLWVAWRRLGPLGLATVGVGAAASAWWIVQPWMRAGRMAEMLTVFANLPQVMPSVSANGHNLWWLKLPGVAISVLDWQPLGGIGPWLAPEVLTHATVGRLGFGLLALLPLLRLTGPLTPRLILACIAYTAGAYFMTITQVHENHQFAAIPFLAAAAALDGWFLLPFAITSLCSFLNMGLHDFLVGETLAAALPTWFPWLPWREPLSLQTANAGLNVAGFALLTLIFLRRPPGMRQSKEALLGRARFVLLAGVLLAGGALATLMALLDHAPLADQAWHSLATRALASGPVEAKLGYKTPAEGLLARAAIEYANLLYTLGGAAAIVGTTAAVAGGWWVLCAALSGAGAPPEGHKRRSMTTTTAAPAPRGEAGGLGEKVRLFLEAIKFEHTIFALPFAYLGMLLAARGAPTFSQFLWITVAMAAARTLAMAMNRLIDREIDARNPRTANRALPRRLLSAAEMGTFAVISAVVLAVAAWQLNPLCLQLLPGAVVILVGYSYTKRFTWLSHGVLGIADALAPIGAWAAVTATVPPEALLLGFAVAVWIAGFDLLYACQDVAFDRVSGLHSVPARFGIPAALAWSKVLHLLTVGALAALGMALGLGVVYWLGVAVAALLLIYEHSLLKPHDLSRLDMAFFNVNGYIAVTLFLATAGDLTLSWFLAR